MTRKEKYENKNKFNNASNPTPIRMGFECHGFFGKFLVTIAYVFLIYLMVLVTLSANNPQQQAFKNSINEGDDYFNTREKLLGPSPTDKPFRTEDAR